MSGADRGAWYAGVGVALAVALIGGLALYFVDQARLRAAEQQAETTARVFATRLTDAMTDSERLARVLAKLPLPEIATQDRFEDLVRDLVRAHRGGDYPFTMQWSPQAVVRFSYPLAGNEAAIGLDLLADPRVAELTRRSIQSGQPRWDGPFTLRQGGIGLIYRTPVYLPGAAASEQSFLGLATVLLNVTQIAKVLDADIPGHTLGVVIKRGGAKPVTIEGADFASADSPVQGRATIHHELRAPSGGGAAGVIEFDVRAVPLGFSQHRNLGWQLLGLACAAIVLGGLAHVLQSRRAAQRAMRQSEADLQTFLDTADTGLVRNSRDLRYVAVNASYARLVGRPMDEIVGRTLAEVLGEQGLAKVRPDIERVLQGERVEYETSLPLASGPRWIHAIYTPDRDAAGEIVGWVASVTDITERKAAEVALRESLREKEEAIASLDSTLRAMPDLVFELDAEGRYLQVWASQPELLAQQRELLLGRTINEVLPPEAAAECMKAIAEALEQGQSQGREICLPLAQGTSWFELSAARRATNTAATRHVIIISRDITARKAAETALQQFKHTLDATQDCVFMFHPDTLQFFYVNQGACEQVGYSQAELLAMHPYDLKPEYPEAKFREMVAPLLQGDRQSLRFETVHRHRDGHDVPVEVFLQVITLPGEPARFLNIVTDITERKRGEAAVAVEERRMRNLVTLSADWYWRQDADFRFTELTFNRSVTEDANGLRIDMRELPGLGLRRWEIEGLTPISCSWEEHRDALHRQQPFWDFEYARALPAGGVQYVAVSGYPMFDEEGNFTGYEGTARDVTERSRIEEQLRESEEKFREAFAGAAIGCAITDAKGTLVSINAAMCDILGRTEQELLGRHLSEFPHPEDLAPQMAQLEKLLSGQIPAARFENRYLRKDGSAVWVRKSVSVVRAKDGSPRWLINLTEDITERKRIEERLREVQKLDAIGQLTGGLAHDFNNLLGVVIGNLDDLGEQLPPGEGLRRPHRMALEAALRGAEVTRSLLAVARRQSFEIRVRELNALLREMLPLVRASVGAAVRVRTTLWEQDLPVRVDVSGFSNAILNLAINARDAMQGQPGEAHLKLRTRQVSIAPGEDPKLREGGYALVEVEDNGPGMNEEVRMRVFEPFFTTKERGSARGTGLGLSMVLGTLEQLGGTARIDTALGAGTTVRLYLPMAPREDSAPGA